MALIDVVKWEGAPDIFAWKFPENNLTTLTQLIVNESQEAVLFRKGKLLSKFGPGKHTLSTENIPLLENLYGIPFGGQNPFTAEVWFVNKVFSLDVKWGTKQPFQLRDPQYSVMIPVRAYGQFGIQVADSEKFLVRLVGTLPFFDKTNVTDYFRGLLLTKATSIIAGKITKDKVCVLDIASHLSDLSDHMREEIRNEFDLCGIGLLNFFINQISIPEDDEAVMHLKGLLSKKAEMDLLGYTYQQERSFDVLGDAAKNNGTSGDIMGVGMGLGMGFGAGGALGGMMKGMAHDLQQVQKQCPHCQGMMDANVKFCPHCGQSFSLREENVKSPAVVCDKCKKEIPDGSKFCPYCGDTYNPCPKCGADLPLEADSCPVCGEIMPVACPQCKMQIPANARFCSECGTGLQKKCPVCGGDINPGFAFCGSCGGKVQ